MPIEITQVLPHTTLTDIFGIPALQNHVAVPLTHPSSQIRWHLLTTSRLSSCGDGFLFFSLPNAIDETVFQNPISEQQAEAVDVKHAPIFGSFVWSLDAQVGVKIKFCLLIGNAWERYLCGRIRAADGKTLDVQLAKVRRCANL
jgi:hypothetical protein